MNANTKLGVNQDAYNPEGYASKVYVNARIEDVAFIRKNKNAPVEFSTMDNYIRLFVKGKWVTVNGISKEEYLEIING